MSTKPEDPYWAMLHFDFTTMGDRTSLCSLVTWGSEAIAVTGEAIYILKPDHEAGFTVQRVFRR